MTSFTQTFGGSAVSPSDVAYAAYSFSTNLVLYWPQFSNGQPIVAARFMNLTATAGSLDVYMPDATLNSVGYDAIVFNAGSQTFSVVNFSGGAIATIAPGQTYYLMLNSNTTQAGGWQTVQFGVGTGSANAAALAGAGLLAVAGLLNLNLAAQMVSNSFTITPSSIAVPYVWTGGSGVITLPTASSVGNGFFFALANNGSGSITVTPAGGNTIDGVSTSVFSQTQSGFILSNGSNWVTIGKGIQNTFAVTLLNLNVAGNSNITETSAQAQNIIQVFTGTLTGNIDVIMPTTVQIYFANNATNGAYSITVKTALGTGIVVVQGTQSILYCDGTNIVNAYTASIGGTISLTAGSAPSPSLSFQSDASSGIFQPNTGQVSLSANGFEALRISSQANSVNFFGLVASATGVALAFGAVGTDTNINISIVPKGTGYVSCGYLDATIIGANAAAEINGTTITASSSFVGPLTGDVTGNVTGNLTGNVTGNVNGTATNVTGVVAPNNGGTGIANDSSSTLTISGNFATTLTVSGITSLTLPTSGTVTALGNTSTGSGSVVLATSPSIASPDLTGTPTAPTASVGTNSTQIATTAYVQANQGSTLQGVSASVATNALTVGYAGGLLSFRSATLTTGSPTNLSVSSLSLVVPSTATLGTINGVQSELALIVAYNAGTPVLCISNLVGGVNLDETTLISPTTISTGATSASVIYSASTVAGNSPFRVVGYINITEATAGTWATAPTLVQGYGGQAMAALQSLGYGQTWQVFTVGSTRVIGTTYYNNTSRPIQLYIVENDSFGGISIIINGVSIIPGGTGSTATYVAHSPIVPVGASYVITGNAYSWSELR